MVNVVHAFTKGNHNKIITAHACSMERCGWFMLSPPPAPCEVRDMVLRVPPTQALGSHVTWHCFLSLQLPGPSVISHVGL